MKHYIKASIFALIALITIWVGSYFMPRVENWAWPPLLVTMLMVVSLAIFLAVYHLFTGMQK